MRHKNLLALELLRALALGAAACGSDDSNPSSGGRRSSSSGGGAAKAGGTHQRRRRDVPRARLPGVGRPLQGGPGHHRQLPGHRLRRRHRAVQRGHRRLRRHRLGDEGRGDHGRRRRRAAPVHVPTVLGAVTVSYNVDGVEPGPQARRRRPSPTSSSARSRSGTTRRSPARTRASACRAPTSRSATAPTSRARRRTSRRSSPTTRPAWKSGPGVDKSVKWPTGTGAKGNDGVAGCVKQNEGRGRLRRAGLRAAEQLHVPPRQEQGGQVRRAVAEATSAAGEGVTPPGGPALQHDQRAERRTAYPITARHVPARLGRTPARPGRTRPRPSSSRTG